MTMDTTDLSRALHTATEDLAPRPGFTAAVVRGGRRRHLRNRVVIATAAATVTAIAGAATYVTWTDPDPGLNQPADSRLTQPTRGELAGDRAFLNEAAAAWRAGLPPEGIADLRGQPHVYWAGNTPAGRAAVVMQPFFQSRELPPGDPDRTATLIGLVATDPADGRLKVVYLTMDPVHDPATSHAFRFGPHDRTILVVAGDSPLWLSTNRRTGADGRVIREWQSMPITDGVFVAALPEDASPNDARVLARKTPPAADDMTGTGMLYLEPSSFYLERTKPGIAVLPNYPVSDRRLQWRGGDPGEVRVGDTGAARVPDGHPMSVFLDRLREAGMLDFGAKTTMWGGWSVVAGLADGRTAMVGECTQDEHPSRIYALLFNRDGTVSAVVPGEEVDPAAALPVKLRLPDAQGWVVAQRGAQFAFRLSPDDPWQDAGPKAALLPDAAVQVRVTTGGTETVVDLPR